MTKVMNISVLPDSTQNFLEVYRKRQRKSLGSFEKRLIGVILLLSALFLTFFILFLIAEYYFIPLLKKEKVCTSKECIESAMTLLQTVDFSQDPCEDFYKFACGRFEVDHPIPDNSLHNSWFMEKEIRLSRLILKVLKSPVSPLDLKSVRQMKEFYQACANRSELNSIGLKPLYDILELLELPKFIPNSKTVGNFSLGRTLALAQRILSQDILVAVTISRGTFNTTQDSVKNATILKISPGLNGINAFDIWKPFIDTSPQMKSFKFRRKRHTRVPRYSDRESSRHVIISTIKFIAAIIQEIGFDLQIDQEIPKGDNASSQYVTTAYKILTFTSELVKDSEADANETESQTGTDQTTFSGIQAIMDAEGNNSRPSNRIDWREYISTLFEKVNNTYDVDIDPIKVENVEYFKYLSKVLSEAKPEAIQRHIWWRIVDQYARHTTSDIRSIYYRYYQSIYGERSSASRGLVCAGLIKDVMNVALSYEMSRFNNFSSASEKVRNMLEDIEKAFEVLVESISWMDPQTKSITLDKANSVTDEIGYAGWVTEPEEVEKHYERLELKKSEFLMNLMRISQWEVHNILEILGADTEYSTGKPQRYTNPLQVNAYYSRVDNAIIVPAGILQTPFYFRGLESLNYGAIGSILGHELTHGFDVEGKNYNKFGTRQDDWWPGEITAKYEAKAQCFIDQYENYTLFENNKLNGTYTLAENIADNGGIRESFKAYQLYTARHGYEQKLPGFENFTHEQLLFLSYANIWCETSVPKYYKHFKDSHSPHRIRVLASLQNMKEFSTVYNCSKNSFMNPVNKCVIW